VISAYRKGQQFIKSDRRAKWMKYQLIIDGEFATALDIDRSLHKEIVFNTNWSLSLKLTNGNRSRPHGHSAAGRIRSIKKSNDIGNRSRDLPACSIVSQPTTSKSKLLYDCRFTANQFILAPNPLRITTREFFRPNPCGHSPYVTSPLTRRWGCLLRIWLSLLSSVRIVHRACYWKFLLLHYIHVQVLCQSVTKLCIEWEMLSWWYEMNVGRSGRYLF
jgi:hypothetical protein